MMKVYRTMGHWRGIAAIVMITAGALVAALYGVMAAVILRED